MKYKFTKIILLTAVVAGLTTACTPDVYKRQSLFSACDDYLTVESPDQLTSSSFWRNQSDACLLYTSRCV